MFLISTHVIKMLITFQGVPLARYLLHNRGLDRESNSKKKQVFKRASLFLELMVFQSHKIIYWISYRLSLALSHGAPIQSVT